MANDLRIATEILLPESVADDDGLLRLPSPLSGQERAAGKRSKLQQLKEVGRHRSTPELYGFRTDPELLLFRTLKTVRQRFNQIGAGKEFFDQRWRNVPVRVMHDIHFLQSDQ